MENHLFSFYRHCNYQLFYTIKSFSQQNPDNEQLQYEKKFLFLEFRVFNEYAEPPLLSPAQNKSEFQTDHIHVFSDTKRNCKVCYRTIKKEMKV